MRKYIDIRIELPEHTPAAAMPIIADEYRADPASIPPTAIVAAHAIVEPDGTPAAPTTNPRRLTCVGCGTDLTATAVGWHDDGGAFYCPPNTHGYRPAHRPKL